MSYVIDQELSKAKQLSYSRKIDALLAKIDENIRATKEINKENDRLKKLNDRSMRRLKKSIDSLASY